MAGPGIPGPAIVSCQGEPERVTRQISPLGCLKVATGEPDELVVIAIP